MFMCTFALQWVNVFVHIYTAGELNIPVHIYTADVKRPETMLPCTGEEKCGDWLLCFFFPCCVAVDTHCSLLVPSCQATTARRTARWPPHAPWVATTPTRRLAALVTVRCARWTTTTPTWRRPSASTAEPRLSNPAKGRALVFVVEPAGTSR